MRGPTASDPTDRPPPRLNPPAPTPYTIKPPRHAVPPHPRLADGGFDSRAVEAGLEGLIQSALVAPNRIRGWPPTHRRKSAVSLVDPAEGGITQMAGMYENTRPPIPCQKSCRGADPKGHLLYHNALFGFREPAGRRWARQKGQKRHARQERQKRQERQVGERSARPPAPPGCGAGRGYALGWKLLCTVRRYSLSTWV